MIFSFSTHPSTGFFVRFLLPVLLLAVGCSPAEAPPAFDPADLRTVELPALETQQPATRERLRALHRRAERAAEKRPADPSAVAEAFGELGSHLTAVGFFEAAASAFENARRAEPETFRWHYYLGVVRQDDSKLEPAVDAYADALRLEPDDSAARLHRVEALLDLDRIDEAAAELKNLKFDGASPSDGISAAAAFARARIAAARGRHGEAVDDFERTLELQPTATAVHYPLSQSYLRLGDRPRAEQHLALRGEVRPRFEDPLVDELGRLVSLTSLEIVRSRASGSDFDPVADLGFTLANLGSVGGAPEHMERLADEDPALRDHPEHGARFRYLLGGLWVSRGADDRAEPQFRRALELDPSLTAARVKLGNLLARRGELDRALNIYTAVVDRDPDHVEARIKRAAVLHRTGRFEEALEDLETAYASGREQARTAVAMAAGLDRLGRSSEAETLLEQTLDQVDEAEEKALLHKALGDRLKSRERFEEALLSYGRALALQPDFVAAGLETAAVSGHLGRFGEAARAYEDVLAKEPGSVIARRGQVTALLLSGKHREAVRSLEAALRTAPDDLGWSHALARLLAASPDDAVRDGARAVRLAGRVFDRRPSLAHGETLAMAHAEHGDFDRAATLQRNLVTRVGRPDVVDRLERRLAVYESGRPFRAASPDDLIVSAPNSGDAP